MPKLSFGEQLKALRQRGRDPQTGRSLTQAVLADLLGAKIGAAYTGATISNWERSENRLPDSPRRPVMCLLQVLHAYSALNETEAQDLLAAGDYRELSPAEKTEIFGTAATPAPPTPPTAPMPFVLRPGTAPHLPQLLIGREADVTRLRERLQTAPAGQLQRLTIVPGWPGLGKTSLAATLAHDATLMTAFPDGVLWVSLGPTPNLLTELATWGRALGTEELLRAKDVAAASARLTAMLRDKRMLLVVDDVWEADHAVPFLVGGQGCAALLTTRMPSVAQALAPTEAAIYKLSVLAEPAALALLTELAPAVIPPHRAAATELARDLEGLPLALQVAGRLLNIEHGYGFGVEALLQELRAGVKILAATAPKDRIGLANETSVSVAVLLQKSTDRLDAATRDCYAYLGVFAPKPATFDAPAMQAVWEVPDPQPIIRQLVGRGLLEYVPQLQRYQMHALLVAHAKSLVTEE